MAFEHNDIATKNRLMSGLGEELMGYEHNDIVTTDVMNKAIEEGGGGGGDFSIAQVTVVNNSSESRTVYSAFIQDGDIINDLYVDTGDSVTCTDVLYMGVAHFAAEGVTVTLEGDAEFDEVLQMVKITGDCTITLTDAT